MAKSRPKRFKWFTPLQQQWEDELRQHLIECTSGTPPPEVQARMRVLANRAARLRNITPEHLVIGLMKGLAKK